MAAGGKENDGSVKVALNADEPFVIDVQFELLKNLKRKCNAAERKYVTGLIHEAAAEISVVFSESHVSVININESRIQCAIYNETDMNVFLQKYENFVLQEAIQKAVLKENKENFSIMLDCESDLDRLKEFFAAKRTYFQREGAIERKIIESCKTESNTDVLSKGNDGTTTTSCSSMVVISFTRNGASSPNIQPLSANLPPVPEKIHEDAARKQDVFDSSLPECFSAPQGLTQYVRAVETVPDSTKHHVSNAGTAVTPSEVNRATSSNLCSTVEHKGGKFFTKFVVFVPTPVDKVWLKLRKTKDKVEMTMEKDWPSAWFSDRVEVTDNQCYSYHVRLAGTSHFFGLFKSKGDVVEELADRVVLTSPYQRDIFDSREKPDQPLGIVGSTPLKYFLVNIASSIMSSVDVQNGIADVNILFSRHKFCSCTDSVKHELIRFATERTDAFHSRPLSAAFILYVIARMLPEGSNLEYSGISSGNVQHLLGAIQNSTLAALLGDYMNSSIVLALTLLVKIIHKPNATWTCFAYWCYPMLPGRVILDFKHLDYWPSYENNGIVSNLVDRLCKRMLDDNDAEQLFLTVVDGANVLSKLRFFRRLRQSNLPDVRYQSLVNQCEWSKQLIVDQLKNNYYRTSQLKDVDDLVKLMSEVNKKLLQDCASDVAECTLSILKKYEDVSSYIDNVKALISHPVIFAGNEFARKVLCIIADSQTVSLHKLFWDCLENDWLTSALEDKSVLHLLDIWLKRAKNFRFSKRYNTEDLYIFLSRLSAMPLFKGNPTLTAEAEEVMVSHVRKVNQEDWRKCMQADGLSLFCQHLKWMNGIGEHVRCLFRPDLEDAIFTLISRARYCKEAELEQLTTLLLSKHLFVIEDSAYKALEGLALSTESSIHSLLLKVMQRDKFWTVIKDEKLYDKLACTWIETASKHSLKEKARWTSSGDHIPYLYQYLLNFLSLPQLSNYPAVQCNLELKVKLELESHHVVGILSSMVVETSHFGDDVREMIAKHSLEIESGRSLNDQDLLTQLDEVGRDKWDLSDRSSSTLVTILLTHANVHISRLPDNIQKQMFVLHSSAFWRKVLVISGSKKYALVKMDVVQTVRDLVSDFSKNLTRCMLPIRIYHQLKSLFKQKGIEDAVAGLIEIYSGKDSFQDSWKSIGNKLQVAKEKLTHLEVMDSALMQKLHNSIAVDQFDVMKEHLCVLKSKLSENSEVIIAELSKTGFFGELEDIIDMSRELHKLRGLKTFHGLAQKAVKELHSKTLSASISQSDDSLSICLPREMYDEPESLETSAASDDSITYVALIKYLATFCRDEYKTWLETVTDNGTLADVTRYSNKYKTVWEDVREAAEIFKVRISDHLIPALQRLEELDSNKQRIENIEKVLRMPVFNIKVTATVGLFKAITTFQQCVSNPNSVTVTDLASAMSELKDLLHDSDKHDDWWDTVEQLAKATDLVKFLSESVEDDFRNLIDAVEERSEQTIDESTVSDLIRVKTFLQPVFCRKGGFPEPRDFVSCLRTSLEKETIMSTRINNCALHLHGLKALYQHVANRGALTKEIIKNAMMKGCYKWSLEEGKKTCHTMLTYKKNKAEKFVYDMEAMNDLKSRALLLSTAGKTGKGIASGSDKSHKDLSEFIDVIVMVQEISQIVNELHQLGHFSYLTYSKELHYPNALKGGLTNIQRSLSHELETWKGELHESRLRYLSLNYVFSDQLSILSTFFIKRDSSSSDASVESVLQFVHPGTTKQDLSQYRGTLPASATSMEKLQHIGYSLDEIKMRKPCPRKQFPTSKELSKAKNVNAVVHPGQLCIIQLETGSTQTIPVMLSLFAHTMGHYPFPSEVVFCHSSTSWEEVYLLIQRCIKMKDKHELHCIANIERLSNAVQYELVQTLGNLLTCQGDAQFRLAIICRGHQSICDHFSSFVRHVQGFDAATMKACLQNTWQEVTVITSAVPGLGKTEKIIEKAASKYLNVKSVHVSGPISRHTLVDRLRVKNVKNKDVLHLDIGEVDDVELLDAGIFELIVLGCLCAGTEVAHLATDKVMIEVANTLNDQLRNDLVVLSCFRREHYHWQNFADFVVSTELRSPVQVVCQYLKSLDNKTLDTVNIKFFGSDSVTPLPGDVCRSLLVKYIPMTDKDLSFTIVEIFLNVLAGQLLKLSGSPFFTVQGLKGMLGPDKTNDVRSKLVIALMDVAKEFACRSVKSCRALQALAETAVSTKADLMGTTAADLMAHRIEGMLQWQDSNHLLIVFNARDAQSVSLLYRSLALVPPNVKELFKSQMRKDLPDFGNLSQKDLVKILEKIATVKARKPEAVTDVNKSYAITPDNVLKMVLILLRITANLPVVIMGETGCGKTSLIRYLAYLCETEFHHFNIHAGITAEMIAKEVNECHEKCKEDSTKQLWLFLDEINTCEHMGLLTEIVCHHSCFGKPLAKNLVLLAACNPYRLRDSNQITTAGLDGKIKTDEYSKLVYRVHPLPETMIDYVWDYGTLSCEDEKSYVKQMVLHTFIEPIGGINWPDTFTNLLIASQNFIKEHAASSSCISLRDVHRCRVLVEFFYKMLKEKKPRNPASAAKDEKAVKLHSIILALAHCYQSRLATAKLRISYWKRCSSVLWNNEDDFEHLMHIVQTEQLDLLNRMDLPQGIAKNTALCENVFVILVCILNRIPIFLVGKPGCSKSLSMQLIKSSLRGKDSADEYFQTLPNLYVVSYQGSESSTSDGIVKVFEKAEKYKEANKHENVLPVVLLDEVGLAEVSKFNPLKVLHSLLEPKTGELPNVAVVGISNWSLDAAKMNRAIHLSRPDMDAKELYETGKSISTVTSPGDMRELIINHNTLRALAKAFYEYQRSQHIKNFHGLRDYYALVKYVSRLSQEDAAESSDVIIQKGLLRNFGGLSVEKNDIVKRFLSAMKGLNAIKWKIEDVIQDNLKDRTARHLMIITNADSGLAILVRNLHLLDHKPMVIFGSKFEEDQTDEYSYKTLNRIILCMEEGRVLVLKDLDSIYGSLYDMLNQNYTTVGKKKNCRIALGAHSNPMCQVHDDFRCIVLVDEQKINYSDPPFLNRFEKQLLRFDDIISASQIALIEHMQVWIDDFSCIPDQPFRVEHSFSGINTDIVPSLIYMVTSKGDLTDRQVYDECVDALLWLVPPDAMLRLSRSKLALKDASEVRRIQMKYICRPVHHGLSRLIDVLITNDSNAELPPNFAVAHSLGLRLVVYTFSNILVDLQATLKKYDVCIQKLGAFKSEKELSKQLKHFFQSKANLLVLQCKPSDDSDHVPLAKFLLEDMQQQHCSAKNQKHICIVFHMERANPPVSESWQFNFLSGWQLVAVDSLEDQGLYPLVMQENYAFNETPGIVMPLLQHGVVELLESSFRPIEQCIRENIVWAFTCISSSNGERSIQEFTNLIQSITNSGGMMKCLSDAVINIIRCSTELGACDDVFHPDNWQSKVAFDLRLLQSTTAFVDAIKSHLSCCITTPLANIIHKLESMSALNSYFVSDRNSWESLFHHQDVINWHDIKVPYGVGCFKIQRKPLSFECPFSQHFINGLNQFEEFVKSDFAAARVNSSNLTAEDELNSETYLQIFHQYKSLFLEKVFFPSFGDILEIHSEALSRDICNHFSFGFSLEEQERITLMLWLCRIKAHNHSSTSAIINVTETVLCIWQYEDLCHALLRLIAQCRVLLPEDIKEILEDGRVQKLVNGGVLDSSGATKDSGLMRLIGTDIESLGETLSENADFTREKTETVPNESFHELVSIQIQEEVMVNEADASVEAEYTVDNNSSSADISEEHVHKGCGSTTVVTHSEELLDEPESVNGEDADLNHTSGQMAEEHTFAPTEDCVLEHLDMNDSTIPEELGVEELRPEERLVENLCAHLFPTSETVRRCDGINNWHKHVSSVLSFSISVSGYPNALHELRVFSDLANLMLNSKLAKEKIEGFLVEIAEKVAEPPRTTESFLNSVDAFVDMYTLSCNLRAEHVASDQIQAFLCMYMSRCMDVNADRDVFDSYLKCQLNSSWPEEGQFVHFGAVVRQCLLESGEEELFEKFTSLIETGNVDDLGENDYLVIIENALRVDARNRSSLLVLCADVIRRVVFEKHDWRYLEFIESADDVLLTTFKAAVDVLECETLVPSLQTASAAAFVDVFSFHLSSILSYDYDKGNYSSHHLLISVVNSVYDKCGVEFIYIVMRKLLPARNVIGLKRLLSSAKGVLPSLIKCRFPEDDLLLSLGHRVLGESAKQNDVLKQCLMNVDKDDDHVRKFVSTLCSSTDNLMAFIEVIAEVCYVVRSVRPLKDTELRIETWMKDNAAAVDLTAVPRVQTLIQCLAAGSSFNIELLRLTPESSYLHLLQATVLIHLVSVTIARRSENSLQFFWNCIDSPTQPAVGIVRQTLLSQQDWQFVKDTRAYIFTTCNQCFTRSCRREASTNSAKCTFCVTDVPLQSVKHDEDAADGFCCISPGQQIAKDFLLLFVDGCLLSSLGLGSFEWSDLSVVFQLENSEQGRERATSEWQERWKNLAGALQCTDEQLGNMIHYILDNSISATPGIELCDEAKIRQSLIVMEECIMQKVWKPSLPDDLKHYRNRILIEHDPPLRRILLEVADKEPVHPVLALLRQTADRSLEHMKLQLYLQQRHQMHLVLAVFFEMKDSLALLKHMLPILKWSLVCQRLVNYTLSRAECREMTLEKLLANESDKDKECYSAFENAWKELRSPDNLDILTDFGAALPSLPAVHQRVAIQLVLIENKDSVVCRVLKTLADIQNKFLDVVLSVALDGKCTAVGFLNRPISSHDMSCMPAVKCVQLQNANRSHLIDFDVDDLTENLVKYAQNDLSFGRGDQIYYNFTKIEMDLANLLVLNKAYLLMTDAFPTVVYANEMFVSCASVLREFKSHIPQYPLSQAIVNGIKEKQANNADYVQQMIRQIEVLLSLVKKTGGTDQTIDSYIQAWQKSLPGGFAAQLLPTGGEPLRLSHLVALYEHMESLQADAVVNTLPDNFKEPLSEVMTQEFSEFIEGKNIPTSCIEVALKRFIVRNLINFDFQHMDLDQPLVYWIVEPSLWPEANDFSDVSLLEAVTSGFPKVLNLSHAYSLLEYVKQLVTEKQKHVKWMTTPVKPAAVSPLVKPTAPGTRSRSRGKVNMT